MQSGKQESDIPIKVRFAPSPTGYPHIGNIRTALFNWLFARHYGGRFILRIEDTDTARKVEGATQTILDSLIWLGLNWDGKPYFQSQRLHLYHEVIQRLLQEGHAYRCYCSRQRLEKVRQEQMRQKQPPRYDHHCRYLSDQERSKLEASGINSVVRFKTPLEGETSFCDLIRGQISFQNSTLDDFILLKSDGYPTYHLANVVDDHFMNISHVLRADEWLSSTPKHMLLYQSLGWQPPQFAHLPMILGPDKSKLSKRHGTTAITEYKEQGYLPQAMINYLALLGWSLDDKTEFFSQEELVKNFSLERVGKAGAIFNKEKLTWMNGVYIRQLSLEEFTQQALPFLNRDLPASVKRPLDNNYIRQVMPLIQERARTLVDVSQLADFFFLEELPYSTTLLLSSKIEASVAMHSLRIVQVTLQSLSTWDAASLEISLRPLAPELGLSTRKFFGLLRSAITGRTASPPLFQTMEVLGKKRCLQRFANSQKVLSNSLMEKS